MQLTFSLSNDTSLSGGEGDSLTVCVEASASPVSIKYTLLSGAASSQGKAIENNCFFL